MGLGKHFKKLKKAGKKSFSKATKVVHSSLKKTGSALKSAAQSELNKYKDLAVGVSKIGQKVVKKVLPNGKDSAAKFLGKNITFVAKGVENGGKVVAVVGDMMIIVGTVTGQPELVAAGAAIDEAGTAIVVGAQVAQEAADALQYTIQGDQKAAMIALAKAAEVGTTGFMNMLTHNTFDNFVAAAVDMSEGNFEGAGKQLGQAALDAVAGELGVPTQDVIAQTDDTTVVDKVAGEGMKGGMVVPEEDESHRAPDLSTAKIVGLVPGSVPLAPGDLGPMSPFTEEGLLREQAAGKNVHKGVVQDLVRNENTVEEGEVVDEDSFNRAQDAIMDRYYDYLRHGLGIPQNVVFRITDQAIDDYWTMIDAAAAPNQPTRVPMGGEGPKRRLREAMAAEDPGPSPAKSDVTEVYDYDADVSFCEQVNNCLGIQDSVTGRGSMKPRGFHSQSYSVRTAAPLSVASLHKPGLASSKNYPAARSVKEENKGDMFRSPHNLKLRKANTQRGFSGPYKIGKRQAASGLRAVGATMKRSRTIRHMPPNQYKDTTYYAIEKMQRTRLRRQDDVLIESDRVTRSMVLG